MNTLEIILSIALVIVSIGFVWLLIFVARLFEAFISGWR
jgi:hypothetical protein